ncbi:WhiB family transcriptional regulator [Streptomyces sp. NPDC088261]|uniref:WhiB family transcriptional regulator n=1 Tax=Streptomyces sp. NPDC088261 TaxID=3365851 RepID=UPI00382F6ED3
MSFEPARTAAQPIPACAGMDPEIFFPHALATGDLALAKNACDGCPVKVACLQGALERGEQHGVWGGLSEDERRTLKRRAARERAA